MRRIRIPISLLLAIAFLASTIGASLAAPGSGGRSVTSRAVWSAETEECAFLSLINQHRKNNGLGALTISMTLSSAADYHSTDMARNDYFSHTLFDGTTWSQNIANFGYPTNTTRGENIAAGNETAASTFQQWKASPTHNANMLSTKFNAIGIGRASASGSRYTWYWTNTFGSTVDQPYACPGQTISSNEVPGTQLSIVGGGRTSSSTNSGTVYDGKRNTSWYTTTSGAPKYGYVYVDLGAAKTIGKIQWYFAKSGAADSYKIQVSSDKATWTTVSNQTSGKSGTWYSKTVSRKARYVRVYFNNPNGDTVLGYLGEVKIIA